MNDRVSRLTPDGRTARWAEHRAARRDELIDRAIAAIAEFGSDVGMDQIAASAGTSKPVIYRYFDDKRELYRAVGQRVVTRIVDALQAVHDAGAELDARVMLRRAIDGYLSLLDDNPELFRFIASHRLLPEVRSGHPQQPEPSEPPESAEKYESADSSGSSRHTDPITAILTRTLGGRLADAGLDPAAAEPWGEAAIAFIRAASLWWLDHPGAMTRSRLTDYLAALLWGGAAGVLQSAGADVDARPAAGVFRVAGTTQ